VGFVLLLELFPLSPSTLIIVWGLTSVVSATAATAVWIFSTGSKAPWFWRYMSFVGFSSSLMIIYTTAKEIVNVVLAFGVVFEVGSLILGVTVLAIGIGAQDLVTCVAFARAGFSAMAASASIGCATMTIFVGIGLSGILGPMLIEDPYRLYISLQLLSCLAFMLSSGALAIGIMWAQGWRATRFFGGSLIALYALFIVVSVMLDAFGATVQETA